MSNTRERVALFLGCVCLFAAGCAQRSQADAPVDVELAMAIRGASKSTGVNPDDSAAASPTVQTTWGNLRGRFRFDGPPPSPSPLTINKDVEVCGKHNLADESLLVASDGGLANVVIFVSSKNVPVRPTFEESATATVQIDNIHCHFEPHILTLRVSQTLAIHNSDSIGHNSNMSPLGDKPFNSTIKSQDKADYRFKKEQRQPTEVICNVHPWMKGYVFPRDNPYVAVSKPDGTFEMPDLPAGEWEFTVWHERSKFLPAKTEWKKGKFKLAIAEGDNDLGEIAVAAELLAE